MATLVGKTIAGYSLTEPLGRGPTGETFAASKSGQPAAVKLVHGRLSLMDRVQAMTEAHERLAALSHPHVVLPAFTKWTTSGRFLMASALLDGLSLDRALRRVGALAPSQVLRFAGQVCLALEAAHKVSVTHGALTPTNIFLCRTSDGFSTRVTDFATQNLLGGKPDEASDIHALGAVIYLALTGKPATAGETAEVVASIEADPRVPAALREIISRAMADSPMDRYDGVKALREALEGWAASGPTDLEEPPVPLFETADVGHGAKDAAAQGVATTTEDRPSVLVSGSPSGDDVPRLSNDEEPINVASNDGKQMGSGSNGTDRSLEEQELAAMAEQASAALRKQGEADDDGEDSKSTAEVLTEGKASEKEPAAKPAVEAPVEETKKTKKTKKAPVAARAEGGEEIELPQERTVRAFVSNISPSVTDPDESPGNGESLELAFDQFVSEAKAVNIALPAPIVSDAQLADLAKIPVAAPMPAPEPAKAKEPLPVAVPLTPPPPPPKKSPLPALLGGLVVGGLLVFGGMKLLGDKTPATPTGSEMPAASAQPVTTDDKAAGEDKAAVPTPAAAAATAADATAATTNDAATAAAPAADAVPAAEPDAAAAVASADASVPTAEPDAAAAPTKAVAAAVQPKKAVRKRRSPKRRAARAAKKAARKRTKKKTPAAKPKKKKSDWVDPFSQ